MSQSVTHESSPLGSQPPKASYARGYYMHVIHGKRVVERPWGWRDAVVRSSDDAGHHVLDYVAEQGHVQVWNQFCPRLDPGTPVRVHEEYWAMDVAGRWFNVRLDSPGLGPVPEPDDLSEWIDAPRTVVVSMAEGVALGPEPRRERPDVN